MCATPRTCCSSANFLALRGSQSARICLYSGTSQACGHYTFGMRDLPSRIKVHDGQKTQFMESWPFSQLRIRAFQGILSPILISHRFMFICVILSSSEHRFSDKNKKKFCFLFLFPLARVSLRQALVCVSH